MVRWLLRMGRSTSASVKFAEFRFELLLARLRQYRYLPDEICGAPRRISAHDLLNSVVAKPRHFRSRTTVPLYLHVRGAANADIGTNPSIIYTRFSRSKTSSCALAFRVVVSIPTCQSSFREINV